jgi:hypothetical protein
MALTTDVFDFDVIDKELADLKSDSNAYTEAGKALGQFDRAAESAPYSEKQRWIFGNRYGTNFFLTDGTEITLWRVNYQSVAIHIAVGTDRVVLLHIEKIGNATKRSSAKALASHRRSAYNWKSELDA